MTNYPETPEGSPTPQQMAGALRNEADDPTSATHAMLMSAAAYIEAAAKREEDRERAIAEAVQPWRELVERAVPWVSTECHSWHDDARALLEKP